MEVKYSPKTEGFSGHVSLIVPTYFQRSKYIEEAGFAVNAEGMIESNMKNIGTMARLVQFSAAHYKEVALTHTDGSVFSTFEAMTQDPICDQVLIEIALLILNGIRPAKN